MHPIRHVRRLAAALAGLAGALLTLATVSPAAFARPGPPSAGPTVLVTPQPLPPGWYKHLPLPASAPQPALRFPPGWNKHPPLPPRHISQVHTIVIGGMPGWQIALIAVGAALLAATAAVLLDRAWGARRRVTPTAA